MARVSDKDPCQREDVFPTVLVHLLKTVWDSIPTAFGTYPRQKGITTFVVVL